MYVCMYVCTYVCMRQCPSQDLELKNRLRIMDVNKSDLQHTVSSISKANAPRTTQGPVVPSEGQTYVVDSQRWRVIPTYWDMGVLTQRFGSQQSKLWVELSEDYPDLEMIETSIDFPEGNSGICEMDVMVRAREGRIAVIRPEDELCRLRLARDDDNEAVELFGMAYRSRLTDSAREPAAGAEARCPGRPAPSCA